MIATGAGAETRQALGTVVCFGMVGVTVFGLFLTPVFFTSIRWLLPARAWAAHRGVPAPLPAPPPSE